MTACYPPVHHHSTTRIPTSTALSLLSEYLEATITDAALHPNALLTDSGPTTASSGTSTGLVLHNLRRVEAGLKGEHLGTDLTFEQLGGEGLPGLAAGNTIAGAAEFSIGELDSPGQGLEGDWQDKAEFERQQDVVQGEIGERDYAVPGGLRNGSGHVPRVKATKSVGEKDARKDARKEAKKERRKQDRTIREEKRKKDKDAEG